MPRRIQNALRGPGPLLLVWLLALATIGCQDSSAERSSVAQQGSSPPDVLDSPMEDYSDMRALLARAATVTDNTAGILVDVSCQTDERSRHAQISSRGVVTWNRTHQFRLPPESRAQILQRLLDQRFLEMERQFGTPSAAPQVSCWVTLSLDGRKKSSAQFSEGPQSEELRRLANAILDDCEAFAGKGVSAESLEDGLAKIVLQELEPEALHLFAQRMPTPPSTAEGFHLSLHGCRAEARSYDSESGVGDPIALELECDEVTALASRLAELAPWGWPANFWAEDYTDLSLQVLNHRQAFQAKRFAGLDAEGGVRHQSDFDETVESLRTLHERVMTEGRPIATEVVDETD